METVKNAAETVKSTATSVAQKGGEKLFGQEDTSRQKAEDKEVDKTENVRAASGAPDLTDEYDIAGASPTEKASSLVDNLSKLGPSPLGS